MPDGMHSAVEAVQPEPATPASCAKDRALVALAELVLSTRDSIKRTIGNHDEFALEPWNDLDDIVAKLDRFEGVCRQVLHPNGNPDGAAVVEKRSRGHLVEAGKKGGAVLLARRGPEWFSELGRRGAASRAAKRALGGGMKAE